jgi:NodT family efflux transporter outer membrane factor (OMF) lipoprotein
MGKLRKNVIFLTLSFTAIGCNQDLKEAKVLPSPTLNQPLDEAYTSMQFCKGDWPTRQWWDFFADQQLSYLIEKGLRQSPTLKRVQAKFGFAQQEAKKIRSALFPSLSANYNESWSYFSKNGFVLGFYPLPSTIPLPSSANILDLSLNFSYEFDFWGKNRKKHEAALGLAMSELAQTIQAELILSSLIAFSYFQSQTSQQQIVIYEKILNLWESTKSLLIQRRDTGLDSAYDVLRIQEKIDQAQKKLLDWEKEHQIDLIVLKNLIGEDPDSLIRLTYAPTVLERPFPLPPEIGMHLLARRPDLISKIWVAESASKQIGVARTEFYPNVNLNAIGGFESLHFNTLLKGDSLMGALIPSISLPLFTGGRLEANLQSKIAFFNEAVEDYNEGLLQAVKEVATELKTLGTLYNQIEVQKNFLDTVCQKETLTLGRYSVGLDNQMEVFLNQIQVLENQSDMLTLQNYRLLSTVRLIKSLGGGFEADNVPIIHGGY